jgi:hypothetical protein
LTYLAAAIGKVLISLGFKQKCRSWVIGLLNNNLDQMIKSLSDLKHYLPLEKISNVPKFSEHTHDCTSVF